MFLLLAASCSTADLSSSVIEEDKLYVTRTFIGNFIDFRYSGPDMYGNPELIWLNTTLDSIHGKISAYGKECMFTAGERLYLRRTLTSTGKDGRWVYQVENSSSVSYLVNEYQNHNNVLVKTFFNSAPEETQPYYINSGQKLAQELEPKTVKTTGSN